MMSSIDRCPNPQCGCPVQPTDRFCAFCGQPLVADAGKMSGKTQSRSVPSLKDGGNEQTGDSLETIGVSQKQTGEKQYKYCF